MKYRSEIDGLRAVAVVPVILFHAGLTRFSGGYVGVDIFFVISGYLITGIIAADLDRNVFSVVRFYERRARRILPALFVVLATCLPFLWLWTTPAQLEAFADSLTSVALFSSNIFFLQQGGYFAPPTELMPLLHTWSLAVEEQYYLVFPLLLMATWRFGRRWNFGLICTLAVASFVLSEWGWRHIPTANFYLAPTRAWELFAGSICAFVGTGRARRYGNVLAALGLALIVFAIFRFDATTPFPSAYALVPVGGAVLILLFATEATWAARLLSLRPIVWIGLVSYSAYLWHQPIFAITRLYVMGPLPPHFAYYLTALVFAVAYLSYRFVERPFRKPDGFSRRQIFAWSVLGLAAFAALGLWGSATQGVFYRFRAQPDRLAFARFFENGTPGLAYFRRENILAQWHDECNFYDAAALRAGLQTDVPKGSIARSCIVRDGRKAVMLWGDSHAEALRPGLSAYLPSDWQILQVTTSNCPAKVEARVDPRHSCIHSNSVATRTIAAVRPDVVVIARNKGHSLADMDDLRRFLETHGVRRILFVGPSPHWKIDLPTIVFRNWGQPGAIIDRALDPDILASDRALEAGFRPDAATRYLSMVDLFCSDVRCRTYVGNDRMRGLLTFDYGHVTPPAAGVVAQRLLVPAILGPHRSRS